MWNLIEVAGPLAQGGWVEAKELDLAVLSVDSSVQGASGRRAVCSKSSVSSGRCD